ncbi:putative U3 small nucleolar RNA-associated protein 11 [Giardia muris]|uniref:Putative U3 small nucleolar RNA-associated protein 11 n=1 Tax=Giardia muris TaxID=5742 RepID=A0A4Z1TD75_GIAMU|nr:putative U3 small nucleolar RNA-associated protein 11 [Giardia muris]|eukprot:TNJ30489.1 putative U3 small nucleolar RNA-associated protein 11 [Giardia muris]
MPHSSASNYFKRIEKKERPPPAALGKHTPFERKKDYKVRAERSHARKKMVQELTREAAFRNADEFYHAMENLRTDKGLLLKTYINDNPLQDPNDAIAEVTLEAERRRLVRTLEDTLMRRKATGKHIVFINGDAAVLEHEEEPQEVDLEVQKLREAQEKIEQEFARREARTCAQKSGPVYGHKSAVGADKYGHTLYSVAKRRLR